MLAVDDLDIGGIGTVIEMLCDGLPDQGVTPVVLCVGEGERAHRLRARGIEVHSVVDEGSAARALSAARAEVVQLHSAPRFVEDAALRSGLPCVPVLHNTEIHYTRARWRQLRRVLDRAPAAVAVSETVREFHRRRVPSDLGERIVVVPNGAPPLAAIDAGERQRARRRLGGVLGLEQGLGEGVGDDVVFVCLARYDSQKNIAGTVASFLRAVPLVAGQVRLVVAGEPSDWVELLRAQAICRRHPQGDRVHLLGNSDAGALLAAADVFVLDSFFEGWPVAATEAAAVGLPLLLSEVGGAAELVGLDAERSRLVPNPAGAAAAISDARVRVARRRARHQVNAAEVAAAVVALADGVRRRRAAPDRAADRAADRVALEDAPDAAASISVAAMAAAHARVVSAVLRPRGSAPAAGR